MRRFKVLQELYLTILTRNDSYMLQVPVGAELRLINGNLWYEDKLSIDDEYGLLYFEYITEIKDTLAESA